MKTLLGVGTAAETSAVAMIRPRITELERDELDQVLAGQRLAVGRNIARIIAKQSKEAVYIITRDGRFVDVNKPLLDLLGYTADDLIGEDVARICVYPKDAPALRDEAEKKGYVIDRIVRFLKKDGSQIPCSVTTTVRWYNDEGIPGNQPLFKTWVRKASQ